MTIESTRAISVVMVSYNTGPILWRSIESVLMQKEVCELVLVDNGNSLQVQKQLQEIASVEPRLKLISGQGNVGFAHGCNMGAGEATGDYLLLLNPDCILSVGTLGRVVDALLATPDAWVASCCIVNPDGSEQSGSRRNLLTPWIALVEGMQLYRLAPRAACFTRMNFHDQSPPAEPVYIPAVSGAFMLMKKERYQQLGGMDEQYFFHVEDLDFCFQVAKSGGKILYVPDVKVVHYRSTSKVSNLFIEHNKTRGFAQYFRKNFTQGSVPVFVPLVIASIYVRFFIRALLIKLGLGKEYLSFSNPAGRMVLEEQRATEFLSSCRYIQEKDTATTEEDIIGREPFLLAGASGQVGVSILRRLLAANAKVVAFYHSKPINFSYSLLTWKYADFSRYNGKLCDINAKTLISTSPLWFLPNVLASLPEGSVDRLVCFSSTSIYTKANSGNLYEKELVGKFLWAEKEVARLCAEKGIEWTILRPTLIYGIGLDRNISRIARFIRKFGFFPIAGEGDGLRQPVHTDDLAVAVLKVLNCEKAKNRAFNLCGGEQISYYEMVGRIFDILGKKRRIISLKSLPMWLDIYAWLINNPDINGEIARRMNNNLIFDDSDAKNVFGYAPRLFLSAGKQDLEPDFNLLKTEDNAFGAVTETISRRATL